MLKTVAISTLLLGFISSSQADEYLGNLSGNRFVGDSIENEFAPINNPFNANSLTNRFGPYGNRFSGYSPNNPYSTEGPSLYGTAGEY